MFSKTLLIFFLVNSLLDYSYGQSDEKCFRKDYTYIEASEAFYKIHTLRQSWAEAKRVCALEGASLFYPENVKEANAVISFWNATHPFRLVYVGISDLVAKGVFKSIHGHPIEDVYHNWDAGEPNDVGGVEDCVILRNKGTLNDDGCLKKFPFICKKSLIPNIPYLDGTTEATWSDDTESTYGITKKEKDGSYIHDQTNGNIYSDPTTVSDDYTESPYGTSKKEKDGSYIHDQKNLVTTTRPSLDGSYIQVYQKNEYHNNGDPAKLITVYSRCSASGPCKDIHHLEIALID